MALWAMTSLWASYWKPSELTTIKHCQQGSRSWACMCSSNVLLRWHMHLEHQQSWQFGSSPPLCSCIWSNSSFGFNHCLWHPTIVAVHATTSYLYGHAVEHSLSFNYWSTFGKHFIEAIIHIWLTATFYNPQENYMCGQNNSPQTWQ